MAEKRYIAMSFLVWKTLTSKVAATALPAMEMSEAQAQIPTLVAPHSQPAHILELVVWSFKWWVECAASNLPCTLGSGR